MVKHIPYAAPRCEYDKMIEAAALIAASDLTDEGAGDVLQDGGVFEF